MSSRKPNSGILSKVANKTNTAIENTSKSIESKIQKRAEEKILAYQETKVRALRNLEGTSAENVLKALGDSPSPLTNELAAKAKASFPIPREQSIVWADAEFDLRPSGIIATDSGIFIKSDVKTFIAGKNRNRQHTGESTEAGRGSSLSYFAWEYFEPTWFSSSDPANNPALLVAPECSKRFVSTCRSMKAIDERRRALKVKELGKSLEYKEIDVAATALASAGPIIGEQAVFVDQKAHIHNPGGHGEMAEAANNMVDSMLGSKVEWLGPENEKNGADRKVDDFFVQTKYFNTARGSLESCFDPETGLYRYIDESGKCMQLEVAKDQYEKVLELFKKKIEQGRVPGVHDPAEAEKIVRKGWLTHRQAVNLTKSGTIESLAYDAATGAVICTSAFGISFLAAAFVSYRRTKDVNQAIQAGIAAGIQVFGVSFVQHMVVSQLSRTGLAGTLAAPSRFVVDKIGRETSTFIVNGLRTLMGKPAIGGAAASNQLAKILRSNAITATATFVIFSAPETYRLASGKCTGAQYAQAMSSLAASIAGGAGGAIAAGAAAAKIAGAAGTTVVPGVGTAIGIAGGFIGGAAGSAAVSTIGGIFYEGDGATFGRLFNALVAAMAVEYMFDEYEIDALVKQLDKISQKEFKGLLESTFEADQQEECIRNFLTPRFDEIAFSREKFTSPEDNALKDALTRMALES